MYVDRRIMMNERWTKVKNDMTTFWSSRTKKQKGAYISTLIATLLIAGIITFFMSKTDYVPLYSDVSPTEMARVKEHLDAIGVPNEVAVGGGTILVPKERVDELLVSLAGEGIPNTGTIDYSFFSDNAGFGMTDNEFGVIKQAAMQTEIANLLKSIDGVKDAKVTLTLPEESVFLNDQDRGSSAGIILTTSPGHQFSEQQIKTLYNLVAKSVPNLSTEDIEIANQYFEYYDLASSSELVNGTSVTEQMSIKKTIERDIQRQVQTMLGTMIGHDKVVVSVSTDVDFKQENREESLVTPVDEESMEGIALSVQRITESFNGNAATDEAPMTDDPTDNNTSIGEWAGSDGEYERLEETVNHEVNRIRKEIVESPYKVQDIGIQVMIEPPVADDINSMPLGLQDDVEDILTTIIRTSVDKEVADEMTDNDLEDRIIVSVHPFGSKTEAPADEVKNIPLWVYFVAVALLLIIIVLIILFIRNRRTEQVEETEIDEVIEEQQAILHVEDINEEQETETTIRRKQLEKMAKEKPEEFAKLLRTWISED